MLGNNVTMFLVLLSKGFISKNLWGFGRRTPTLKEETFREIERFISPGSLLYTEYGNRPSSVSSSPQRKGYFSLTDSVSVFVEQRKNRLCQLPL